MLAKGWGFASLITNTIQADNGAGLTQGIIGHCNKGQPRKLDDWGSLRAWAWGASRALDYFETDKAVDAKHVGIEGLSRYGKAALVTMAYDQRFAIGFIGSWWVGKLRAKLWRAIENVAGSGSTTGWLAILKCAGPLRLTYRRRMAFLYVRRVRRLWCGLGTRSRRSVGRWRGSGAAIAAGAV